MQTREAISAATGPVTEQTVLIAQPEAARLLGVERTTIWRMCRRGDLVLVHIGRRALVTRASLDSFVALQSLQSSQAQRV